MMNPRDLVIALNRSFRWRIGRVLKVHPGEQVAVRFESPYPEAELIASALCYLVDSQDPIVRSGTTTWTTDPEDPTSLWPSANFVGWDTSPWAPMIAQKYHTRLIGRGDLLVLITQLTHREQWQQAALLWEDAAGRFSLHPLERVQRAKTWQMAKQPDRARRYYHEILHEDPNNLEALVGLGEVLRDLALRHDGLAAYQRVIDHPNVEPLQRAKAYRGQGGIFADRGDWAHMDAALQQAYAEDREGTRQDIEHERQTTTRPSVATHLEALITGWKLESRHPVSKGRK